MNTTKYKGFTITQVVGRRFYVYTAFAATPSLNPEGYATLNNAKGAITKHLKAQSERDPATDKAFAAVHTNRAVFSAENVAKAFAAKPVTQSRNKREGKYAGYWGRHCRGPRFFGSKCGFMKP